jgi:hypothetical protein
MQLASERGVDYTRLCELLSAELWQAADHETATLMLQAVGPAAEERQYLRLNQDLMQFPCLDLVTLDRLWGHFSEGRFGFRVQQQLWINMGGQLDFGADIGAAIATYETVSELTGWRVAGRDIAASEMIFDLAAPMGHLPCQVLRGRLWGWAMLWSRLAKCSENGDL